MDRRRAMTAFLVALFLAPLMAFGETYEGRPLADVLESLRDRGLDIVYSSRLVRPDMRVMTEPSSDAPRAILNEILPPHGLEARDGVGDRIVIARKADEPEAATAIIPSFNPYRFAETVEVVATAETEPADAIAIQLLPRDIESVAGSIDNVFKVLQTLPGVASTSEFGSRLAVRGGSPDQNLILMDGVEIYNPYRLFGLTSAFNPETVDRFELTPGSLEPRYGDRLSSALVVENRVGRDDELLQGSIGASFLDTNIVLEGRLPGADGSWLLAGRRTYYDLIVDPLLETNLPSYGDVHAKIAWAPRPDQRLSVTALVGSEGTDVDTASFEDATGTADGVQAQFIPSASDVVAEDEVLEVHGRARTKLFAVNFESPLGAKGWSHSTLSYYRFEDAVAFDGLIDSDALASDSNVVPLSELLFARDVDVEDVAIRQELGVDLDIGHRLGAGFELHRLDTSWRYRSGGTRNAADPNASRLFFDNQFLPGVSVPERLDSAVGYTRFGVWFQDTFRVREKVQLTPSVRIDRSGIHGKTYASPRLDAAVNLSRNMRARASTGLYHQSPGYEKIFQSDAFVDLSDEAIRRGLESERAFGIAGGFDWALGAGVSVSFDGYHRRFSDALIGRLEREEERLARVSRYDFPPELEASIPSDPLITTHPVNDGTGTAWGLDIALSKRATSEQSRFRGWVTYSLARSQRSAYGRVFPFDYDRGHAASAVGRFRLNGAVEFSLTARAYSGYPRTPAIGTRVAAEPDRLDADLDGNVSELVPARDGSGALIYTQDFGDVSNRNSARWPTYARLDGRFTFRTGDGNGRWLFYVEVLNLFGRVNTLVVSPTIEFDGGQAVIRDERVRSIPELPNFGVKFRF